MKKIKLLLILLPLVLTFSVSADEYKPLSSSFMIAGKFAYGDIEKGDTHIYIKVFGRDSLEIFNALDTEIKNDSCLGVPSKRLNNIACYKFKSVESSYCAFSINLKDNTLETAESC